jgi:hypothetical protein
LDDYAVLEAVYFIDPPAQSAAEQEEKHSACDTPGQTQKACPGISSERTNT